MKQCSEVESSGGYRGAESPALNRCAAAAAAAAESSLYPIKRGDSARAIKRSY
jgi:hypothetical protein